MMLKMYFIQLLGIFADTQGHYIYIINMPDIKNIRMHKLTGVCFFIKSSVKKKQKNTGLLITYAILNKYVVGFLSTAIME